MKIMKKLSAFLAAAMLVSTLVVPASAAEEWNEVFSDNFESYADDAAIRKSWTYYKGNGGTITLAENGGTNGSKAIKFSVTDGQIQGPALTNKITSGKVLYKAKFKIEDEDGCIAAGLGVRSDAKVECDLFAMRRDALIANSTWNKGWKFSPDFPLTEADRTNKWYELEAVLDLDTHKYTANIIYDGVTYTKTANLSQVDEDAKVLEDITAARIRAWTNDSPKTAHGAIYVDDLSISVPKPAEPWFSDNFEDYADDAALKAVWRNAYGNAAPTVVSDNGSKVMKFTRTAEGNDMLERKLAKEITSGEVVYKGRVKIKHGASSDSGKLLFGARNKTGNQNMNFVYLEKGGMYSNTTWLGGAKFPGYTAGAENDKWFEIEAKINMDTHKYDVTVSDGTNAYTLKNLAMADVGSGTAMTDIGSMFIQTWGGETGATELYLDDVSVSEYKEPEPEPEEPSEGYIRDNFESYADSTALQAKWKKIEGDANAELASTGGVNGSKAVKLARIEKTAKDNNQIKRDLAAKITSGKVVYKGKFKVEYGSTAPIFHIGLRDSNNKNLSFVFLTQTGMYTNTNWDQSSCKFADYNASAAQAGKWFEIEAVIDMDNLKYDVTVTVDGQKYTKTNRDVANIGSAAGTFSDISSLWVQTYGGSDGAIYVDDLSITDYVEPEPEDPSLIMSDDFESYADTAALQKVWKQQLGEKIELAPAKGEDGSKAARIMGKTSDNNWSGMELPSVVSGGKVKYKAKFMPEYEAGTSFGANLLFRDSKGIAFSVVYLTQSGLYTNTNWNDTNKRFSGYGASAAQSGKWFDVEATFDLDKKKYDVSVTDEAGNVYTLLNRSIICIDGKTEFKDFAKVCIQTVPGTGGYLYVDDISMNYVLEPINVEASNISMVKASGAEAALAGTVSASTAAIKIDFGTAVRANTLTDKTVVLKNVTDNKTIAYTGVLAGNTYTMTLSKLLEPGKNYQLTLSKNIKTPAGGTLEDDKTFAFAADSGECEIKLMGAKVGENSAPAVADFKAAQTANVSVKIVNSTNANKDLLIIAAYYNGTEMTGVTYKAITLAKSEYENKTFDVAIDLPANAEADNVKIFAWDKITNMVPYGANLDF